MKYILLIISLIFILLGSLILDLYTLPVTGRMLLVLGGIGTFATILIAINEAANSKTY